MSEVTAVLLREPAPVITPKGISYKAFKELPIVEQGIIVDDVKPAKLYATQDWTEMDKVQRAREQLAALTPEEIKEGYTVEGYWFETHDGSRRIVLGDGHHKALEAWKEGIRLNVRLLGRLPVGTEIIPFSVFRRIAGGVFAE